MRDINRKIARGAAWMVLFKFAQRSLSFISTLILVRLLAPSDFGVIAMAMSIIALLDRLGSFQFDLALIQNQKATPDHFNTAWTFNVTFGLVCFLILSLLAVPASHFYNEPHLTFVMFSLAFVPLVRGFENIGIVTFRKEMRFNKEFAFLIAKKLSGFSITIPLAFLLQSYWALVIGMIGAQLAGTTLSYMVHSYRPKLSLAAWRGLFRFSKWVLFNSILGFLYQRSADFIIGKVSGAHSLGVYNVSHQVSNLVTSELTAPIQRAVFPGFAKMSSDLAMLRKGYVNVLSTLSLFTIPAGAGVAAIADPFVRVVLGDPWVETIPLIQVLAFVGLLSAIASNSLSVYFAVGKPWISAVLYAVALSVLLPLSVSWTNSYGVTGMASAYLVVGFVFTGVNLSILLRVIQLKVGEFAAVMWRPVAATGIMFFSVTFYLSHPMVAAQPISDVFRLGSSVALGVVVYIGAILTLWNLSSKPEGAERVVIGKTLVLIRGMKTLGRTGELDAGGRR